MGWKSKVGTHLVLAACVAGCQSIEPAFSDLVPKDRSSEVTKHQIEKSLDVELTSQSTTEDGKKWFTRHHVPMEPVSPHAAEIDGGFFPLWSQGYWASSNLYITLKFDKDGKYLSHDVRWDMANL